MNVCFMETGPGLQLMEEELARAVVVTVVGRRANADLASVAAANHGEFEVGSSDMSIRAFFLEDFLVLYHSPELRLRMIRRGRAGSGSFNLLLRPWLRQANGTGIVMSFLDPLALHGVPANAWTRRTADVLLHGLGVVVKVDASTEARSDMSDFRV